MTTTSAPTAIAGDRYWMVLIARAVPAAAIAAFITFSANHSVSIGWIALAAFGVLTGAVLIVGSIRMAPAVVRREQVGQGAILAATSVVATVAAVQDADVQLLVIVIAAAFIVSGALELFAGVRSRGDLPVSRDWVFLGAVSVVFGIAVLLIPTDLSQEITIPGKEVPNLTASVVVVGALGAYAAIVAVFSVIAGLSLKWAKHPDAVATGESAP